MKSIEEAAELLMESESAVALTGAGMSKAAGIPTYRGSSDGLWRDAVARQWATRQAFEADPAAWYATFWAFYDVRHAASPSPAHYALRDMVEESVLDSVVTQNIDSLDRQAGTPEDKVLEVHGSDRALSCTRVGECGFNVLTEEWLAANDRESMPVCPDDGAPLKPDIILFNDDDTTIPEHVTRDWEKAWGVIDSADALMIVGTTLAVPTWAEAVADSYTQGNPLIVINPEPTPVELLARLIIHSPAEEALPQIRDLVAAQT
jgi:NAD-dependent deacetylase